MSFTNTHSVVLSTHLTLNFCFFLMPTVANAIGRFLNSNSRGLPYPLGTPMRRSLMSGLPAHAIDPRGRLHAIACAGAVFVDSSSACVGASLGRRPFAPSPNHHSGDSRAELAANSCTLPPGAIQDGGPRWGSPSLKYPLQLYQPELLHHVTPTFLHAIQC